MNEIERLDKLLQKADSVLETHTPNPPGGSWFSNSVYSSIYGLENTVFELFGIDTTFFK